MVTVIALHVRDVGFASHRLHFLFFLPFISFIFYYLLFYYFTWNAKRLSRRAGLSAIAEFLVLVQHQGSQYA